MTGIRNGWTPTENLNGFCWSFSLSVVLFLELITLNGTHSARFLELTDEYCHPRLVLKLRHCP